MAVQCDHYDTCKVAKCEHKLPHNPTIYNSEPGKTCQNVVYDCDDIRPAWHVECICKKVKGV